MSLVRWRFAVVLGIVEAVLQASSVALQEVSKTAASSFSVLAYLLLVLSVPYLAIARRHQWWLSTATTVCLAWLIMVVIELPAVFVATWMVASRSEASFVVGEMSGWWLLIVAPAGVPVLAVLSFLLGGVVRLLTRSPAA